MTIAFNQEFHDTTIFIDGCTFSGCSFLRCRFIFCGTMPPLLEGNSFSECKWEFAGNAANTLSFMTAFYHGVSKEMMEATLENIRNGGPSRRVGDPVVLN